MCSRPGRPAAAAVAPPHRPSSEAFALRAGAVDVACEQAQPDGLPVGGDDDDRPSWTVLGVRMGFTGEQPKRADIFAAIDRMNWTERPPQHPCFDGSAAGAVVNVVLCRRPNRLSRMGVARLSGDRRLIGLEDVVEAIVVLTIARNSARPSTLPSVRQWDAIEETR